MNLVRQLRLQAGLTQELLARAAGTTNQAISAYEVGRTSPNLSTLLRIVDAAGFEMVVTFVPIEAQAGEVAEVTSAPGQTDGPLEASRRSFPSSMGDTSTTSSSGAFDA